MRVLSAAFRVLRAEGALAARDRALDRMAEARRRRSFRVRKTVPPGFHASTLELLGTPPALRLGGVQLQLRLRLDAAARERSTALIYPDRGGFRLELTSRGEKAALVFPAPPLPDPPELQEPGFESAILRAAEAVGAEFLSVDGLAGLPLRSLLAVQRQGLRLSIALHDFAAFCPRPHLLEKPRSAFCNYSRDAARCARCLREDWPVEVGWQEGRRALAAELLAAAERVVYPSDFLRRTVLELFPALGPERQLVSSPAVLPALPPPSRRAAFPPRHLAFAGSFQVHKGALAFHEVVRRTGHAAGVRWTVYGGGDAKLLARLRRVPRVRVRGYYRSGSLPRLLAADQVDLALLLSVVPETYSFTLDECRAAGVPVVAFDLGSPADRIRSDGCGYLVPLEAGAAGIAGLLDELLGGRLGPAPAALGARG